MFLSNIPLELREPVENPLYLASLVALVSSALCGVGLLASYFFNWLIAGGNLRSTTFGHPPEFFWRK